jgi:hypothetical protein
MDAQSTPRLMRQAEPAHRAPWPPAATLATRCVA